MTDEGPPGLHEALDDDAILELREKLHEHHHFHINNPPRPGVAFSLWAQRGDFEFPILSNTGGITVFNGIRKGSGSDQIQPSEQFFDMIAYTYHHHVCVDLPNPETTIKDTWDQIADMFEYKSRVHEEWAGITIIGHIMVEGTQEGVRPEVEPIRNYIDCCTEWGIPEVKDI